MRTSASQFDTMVSYMERNGDISKPTTEPKNKLANLQNWVTLSNVLNNDSQGEAKSIEKWKKVWSDLRCNTRRKHERILRNKDANHKIVLSNLEERVLCLMGIELYPMKPEFVQMDETNDMNDNISEGNTLTEFIVYQSSAEPEQAGQSKKRSRQDMDLGLNTTNQEPTMSSKHGHFSQSSDDLREEDEFDVFGKYVGIQLKLLLEEDAVMAQGEIQSVLTRYRLKKFRSKNAS